ncbi:uncharacterized protein LOC141719204 [Apium graveolens]|uniref:uncharacterized protein LOC141719204 n=1 Tax=Apium graveolens TaxID=4045 RepID=UPI003D794FEC
MSIQSWNFHGLGTPWTFQFLKNLVSLNKPSIIFLVETLSKKDKVGKVKKAIGFEGMFVVDCQGQGGGIALLWKNKDEVLLQSYSINHVDVVVSLQGWNQFRLTGLYGEPNRAKRKSIWDLIRHLHSQIQLPWCLLGDMNNVLCQSDKRGGCLYPNWLIRGFQDVLDECDLQDMELHGYLFTFERGYGTHKWIKIRLDRALVSKSWSECYKDAKLSNLKTSTSDHIPILLEPNTICIPLSRHNLKFENAWLREPVCRQIVQTSWNREYNASFQVKIKTCLEEVSAWGSEFTGNFKQRISRLRKSLTVLKVLEMRRRFIDIRKLQKT